MKSENSALQVFVALSDWTFSDNETVTQPLLSEIAADVSKRQTFADNVVNFMMKYSFNDIDIDWYNFIQSWGCDCLYLYWFSFREYSEATDWEESKEDVKNYVLLLKIMRETFDNSAWGDYELTFTISSSFWYVLSCFNMNL